MDELISIERSELASVYIVNGTAQLIIRDLDTGIRYTVLGGHVVARGVPSDPSPVCTCPLIDCSVGGNPQYVLGRPDGCPRHDTGEGYDKRFAAEQRARYGEPVLLDVSRDPQQHPRDETGRYAQ